MGIDNDQCNHSLLGIEIGPLCQRGFKAAWCSEQGDVGKYNNICEITSITNSQNWKYWADKQLYKAMEDGREEDFIDRKRWLKQRAFDLVADQTGKLMDRMYLPSCGQEDLRGTKGKPHYPRHRNIYPLAGRQQISGADHLGR